MPRDRKTLPGVCVSAMASSGGDTVLGKAGCSRVEHKIQGREGHPRPVSLEVNRTEPKMTQGT